MPIESVVAIGAIDREALLASVTVSGDRPQSVWEPFVKCALPCGHVREWATPDLVPEHSVECMCGELPYRHWFIRYDEPT